MREHLSLVPAVAPVDVDPPAPDLVVRVLRARDGRSVVLVVTGELDALAAPTLCAAWEATVLPPGARVVVDLRSTTYCGAPGLRVLAEVDRRCRRAGIDLQVVASGLVARLLPLVGLGPGRVALPRPRSGSGSVAVPRPRWAEGVPAGDRAGIARAVVDEAMDTVPGIGSAQLTVPTGRRTRGSVGRAGPLGDRLADLEDRLGQGPGWQSHSARADVEVVDLRDAGSAARWPALVAASRDLPVRSVLCLHLGTRARAMGTLTVTSALPAAFGPGSRSAAGVLAAVASLVLGAEDDTRNLREALVHRDTIGQAKGILMERHRLTAEQAFAVLRTASVETNTKLHVVAARVAETGDV